MKQMEGLGRRSRPFPVPFCERRQPHSQRAASSASSKDELRSTSTCRLIALTAADLPALVERVRARASIGTFYRRDPKLINLVLLSAANVQAR